MHIVFLFFFWCSDTCIYSLCTCSSPSQAVSINLISKAHCPTPSIRPCTAMWRTWLISMTRPSLANTSHSLNNTLEHYRAFISTHAKSYVYFRVYLDRIYFTKTENWKYCSKIIFKYVNSVIGLIFNEKITEKWSLWVLWTVHGTHWCAEK